MNITDIKKWNYGNNENTTAIQFDKRVFYFSYNTIVAFSGTNSKNKYFNCVILNYWTTTTGKHLNFIDGGDKKSRLSKADFEKELKEFLK